MFNNLENKTIICGNIINGRRMIIRLNKKSPIINYNLLTMNMLIGDLLVKKSVKTHKEYRLISDKESAYILRNLILSNVYGFDKEIFKTVGSVKRMLEIFNDYRFCEKTSFNNILKVFNKNVEANYNKLLDDYIKYLEDNNLADYIYSLYLVSDMKINSKCYILDDFKLRPLERRILSNIFNSYEVFKQEENTPNFKGFYDCYGAYNEVLNVLKIIEDNNLELGDCELVYSNDIYENFIKGLFDSRGIKYSIKGAHAKSTNLVSFMMDILEYIKNDFKYELLENILSNKGLEDVYLEEFYSTLIKPNVIVGFGYDRTLELLDDIKEDNRKQNFIEFITDLFKVVDKNKNLDYDGFLLFIKKYIKSKRELQALSTKLEQIKYILPYTDNVIETIKDELEGLRYSEADLDDGISVGGISKAFTNRGNLFIIGLSQVYLTKVDTENPFITDSTGYKNELSDESIHLLEYLKKDVSEALDYYINYSDSNIYMSYASINKIEFRPSSPSVYFLNKLSDNEVIKVNEYGIIKTSLSFETNTFKNTDDVEDGFDNGMIYQDPEDEKKHEDMNDEDTPIKRYVSEPSKFTLSPSAISTLLHCPFQYYYQYLKRVTNVEYPKLNDHIWLEVNAKGTFFHEVMELYAKARLKEENYSSKFDEEVFEESFKKALLNALKLNVILNPAIQQKETEELKEAAKNYLKQMIDTEFLDSPYRVLECEYDIRKSGYVYKKNNTEVSFTGFVDRLDGYLDGNTLHLRFVDYKTGKYKDKESHGYVQHVIYPYAVINGVKNQFGLTYDNVVVDSFTYSYPFDLNENRYDDFTSTSELDQIFEAIDKLIISYLENTPDYTQILDDRFINTTEKITKSSDKNLCEYCTYKDICYKRLKEGDGKWCTKKN